MNAHMVSGVQLWAGKRRYIFLLAVLLGAALMVVVLGLQSRGAREEAPAAVVRRGDIVESVYGIGAVAAAKSQSLKSGALLTVRRLYVREGDRVRRNDPLIDLGGAVLKAPFGGTVTRLPVKVGENVFAQTALMNVVDLSDRYVVVSLEQRAALRVRRGQEARLSFEGLREKAARGVVESVYSDDGSFLVRISAPELPPEILPDMTADVAIVVGGKKDALLAPAAALSDGGVRVSREGRRDVQVPVKTGLVDGETVEIIGGELREGDRLIVPKGVKP